MTKYNMVDFTVCTDLESTMRHLEVCEYRATHMSHEDIEYFLNVTMAELLLECQQMRELIEELRAA